MRIVEIRENVVSIRSELRNAFVSFEEMTVSIVALVSDTVREGRPVVGYGFHSAGRYSPQGILRGRLIPRLLQAPGAALLDAAGENVDPFKAWSVDKLITKVDVSWNPAWVGKDQVRTFKIDGDRLQHISDWMPALTKPERGMGRGITTLERVK